MAVMRLKKSKNEAEEEIVVLLNQGYTLLSWLRSDFAQKKQSKLPVEHEAHKSKVNEWGKVVTDALKSIFPTPLEANQFLRPQSSLKAVAADTDDEYHAKSLRLRMDDLLKGLDEIRKSTLPLYTDLPVKKRLFVEDIDSFAKVRDVNASLVAEDLEKNGYFNKSEESVQLALEKILNESFHKKDWGGEYNDMYTSNLLVNGARRTTAFILKGNGLKAEKMEIGDCGKNGDQLVRLFETPADLYVIQFVGNISESIIKDVEGKIDQLAAKGKHACYCIINGQDTARVMKAYGITM